MRVILEDEAEADLERVGDWIAQDNPRRAISFVRELRRSCLGLAKNPRRFQLVKRYASRGVRRRAHGQYLIFSRVDADAVRVVRIINGARDYEALLFGDGAPD